MAKFLFYDDKIINILVKEETLSGGAAVQAYGWIRGLLEAGQDVTVMTAPRRNQILKDDCRDIRLISLYNNEKGIRWLRWLYYRLPFIYREIKKIRPTYLFQGIPAWNTFLLGLICRRLKIKFIIRISNDNLIDDRILKNHSRFFRFFLHKGIHLAHYVLCQNEYQYNRIRQSFPGKKIIKISNPIILKATDEVRINTRRYIAWLGLFQYQKNLKLLYEIACLLKHEQFVIAGKALDKCDEITLSYVDQLRKLPNIKFTGFLQRDEVFPFLANAKFLLNTSHYEGFSNTFLEAMTVGTPIISRDKVNPDSIISRYHLGIVYPDLASLEKQFFTITPESYDEMSRNARAYVNTQHDHKVLSHQLIHYLNAN